MTLGYFSGVNISNRQYPPLKIGFGRLTVETGVIEGAVHERKLRCRHRFSHHLTPAIGIELEKQRAIDPQQLTHFLKGGFKNCFQIKGTANFQG